MYKKVTPIILVLLTLIFISQLYIIIAAINPVNIWENRKERNLIESAASMAKVALSDFQSMATIGKSKGFEDVEALKKGSKYNEVVYRDAKDGDRAIGFANKMVVYRPSTSAIVYQGETPGQKQLKDQQTEIESVVNQVKNSGYISKNSTEVPQVAAIKNVEQLKDNPLYAGAVDGDVVFIFNNEGVLVVYSVREGRVLNAARSVLTPLAGIAKTAR